VSPSVKANDKMLRRLLDEGVTECRAIRKARVAAWDQFAILSLLYALRLHRSHQCKEGVSINDAVYS
jgi:hypothetical protein